MWYYLGSLIGQDVFIEYQEDTFIHFAIVSVSSGENSSEAEWTFPQSKSIIAKPSKDKLI